MRFGTVDHATCATKNASGLEHGVSEKLKRETEIQRGRGIGMGRWIKGNGVISAMFNLLQK